MKISLVSILFLLLLPALAAGVERTPRILFEEGHGARFHAEKDGELDLSLLVGKVQEKNGRVEVLSELSAASLAGADALVISGPFRPFSAAETAAVLDFLDGGGRLALMLHIAPPVAPLLAPLGIRHSKGVVRETTGVLEEQPLNFKVSDLANHPLFAGIEEFSVFGTWALRAEGATALIARSAPTAWMDLDGDGERTTGDAAGDFGLAAAGTRGKGEFVVFGDDAIFQNRYLRTYNAALADRLAQWLRGEI